MQQQSKLPQVKVEELFEAGVHFGHKKHKWNPKMAPYIYGERDSIHIIDLRQTAGLLQIAIDAVYSTVKKNGRVLFVGTSMQSSEAVAECAKNCGQYHINQRWLGGTLTNWQTISKSIKRLEELEEVLAAEQSEEDSYHTKRELLQISRDKDKLSKYLDGIRSMGNTPDMVVVFDTKKDHLAIKEAKTLKIPVIAILDTNCDPEDIEYIIPGNDDSSRSIRYYANMFSSAALIGIEEALIDAGLDVDKMQDGSSRTGKQGHSRVTKYPQSNKRSSFSSNRGIKDSIADDLYQDRDPVVAIEKDE